MRRAPLCIAALSPFASSTARADTRYGAVTFPADEHQHPGGWDYWWGAANIVAESGNRYVVGLAYTSRVNLGGHG